jgi:hypothetical protein
MLAANAKTALGPRPGEASDQAFLNRPLLQHFFLSTTGVGKLRHSERIAIDEPARLHPNEWSSLEVRVVDCSERGFRAQCDARIHVGAVIRLESPIFGSVEAQVSWSHGGELGARFLEPVAIDRARLTCATPEDRLARLLVERGVAARAHLDGHEQRLRREIVAALPIRRL